MDSSLIVPLVVAVIAALGLVWWINEKRGRARAALLDADRLDTLTGWPPQTTQILRPAERLAYSTLKLALPGYLILAQIPISRFLSVPKRNSHAEWMRRLGSQCVDFVVCDVTSQVVAVVELRPPDGPLNDRARRRLDRIARALAAVGIPLHAWNVESLPSVEAARESISPKMPAVPVRLDPQRGSTAAVASDRPAVQRFQDTDREWTRDEAMEVVEVIELPEPRPSTWFDELDSLPSTLPPPEEQRVR